MRSCVLALLTNKCQKSNVLSNLKGIGDKVLNGLAHLSKASVGRVVPFMDAFFGGLAEWSNATVSKTACLRRHRGFESHTHHQFIKKPDRCGRAFLLSSQDKRQTFVYTFYRIKMIFTKWSFYVVLGI